MRKAIVTGLMACLVAVGVVLAPATPAPTTSAAKGETAEPIKGKPVTTYRGLSDARCATKPYRPGPRPRLVRTWHFASAPHLHPMKVDVLTRRQGTAPGRIFLTPYATQGRTTGQTGSVILSESGDPILFRRLPSTNLMNTDFRTQTLGGESVLTFWQGTVVLPQRETNLPPGYPEPGACWYVLDHHYRLVGTIAPRHGRTADLHEFTITPQGTALFLADKKVPMDLTPYGGPANGFIIDQQVQEIDLKSGRMVFTWDALRHLDPARSKVPASTASSSNGYTWDPFHLNSLEQGPHGTLLVSVRHMWAIYAVKRASGRIAWQLGGEESDFSFPGSSATFSWQHMARFRGGHKLSLFDNGCCASPDAPPEQQSHGLVLSLDFQKMSATRARSYFHRPTLHSSSQGGLQHLPGGNALVGWGDEPYYSEYAPAGNSRAHPGRSLLYDARMPGQDISYRAYRDPWVGSPHYPPSAAARHRGNQSVVYASWNGSTKTAAWRVLAGPRRGSLDIVVRKAKRSGFETAIETQARGPYFQVKALDSAGAVIRSSKVVRRTLKPR